MGLVGATKTCLKKFVTFSGRARRPEYWWFWLACVLAGMAASALDALLFGIETVTTETVTQSPEGAVSVSYSEEVVSGPIATLIGVVTFLPLLAANWRRLHDTGRSGLWSLLPLASMVLAVVAGLVTMMVGAALHTPSPGPGGVAETFPEPLATVTTLVVVLFVLGSWALVTVFLLLPTQTGENRFGPEPPG